MYELVSENLSGLGSMGNQTTKINWRKFFSTLDAAKNEAEKDYGAKIEFDAKKGPTRDFKPIDFLCSGDLCYVMYHINKVECEDR